MVNPDVPEIVAELVRWEGSGGHWRVLAQDADRIDVGLFTCDGGEEMGRVAGARTAELDDYLGGRTSSTD